MISDFNMGKNFNNGAYPNMDGPRDKNFLGKEDRCSFCSNWFGYKNS